MNERDSDDERSWQRRAVGAFECGRRLQRGLQPWLVHGRRQTISIHFHISYSSGTILHSFSVKSSIHVPDHSAGVALQRAAWLGVPLGWAEHTQSAAPFLEMKPVSLLALVALVVGVRSAAIEPSSVKDNEMDPAEANPYSAHSSYGTSQCARPCSSGCPDGCKCSGFICVQDDETEDSTSCQIAGGFCGDNQKHSSDVCCAGLSCNRVPGMDRWNCGSDSVDKDNKSPATVPFDAPANSGQCQQGGKCEVDSDCGEDCMCWMKTECLTK